MEQGARGIHGCGHVRLSFAPGEAYQFDWSNEVVLLNGMTVIVKAAHVRLCHSQMPFVRCYPREMQEMVFDANDRAVGIARFGHHGRGDNFRRQITSLQSPLHADVRPLPKLIQSTAH